MFHRNAVRMVYADGEKRADLQVEYLLTKNLRIFRLMPFAIEMCESSATLECSAKFV